MLKMYISELDKNLQWLAETIVKEQYFLYIMGSIFLLGIVTKWIVIRNYGRLIRKAENMSNPKNITLRQIKMRFEAMKQIDGYVANPVLLIKRHLARVKIGILSLNKINAVINWCSALAIIIGCFIGMELYLLKYETVYALSYILAGIVVGDVLEIIDRNSKVKDKEMELVYTIADYLENGVVQKEPQIVREVEEDYQPTVVKSEENNKEDNYNEEQIINQVIGEYLQ